METIQDAAVVNYVFAWAHDTESTDMELSVMTRAVPLRISISFIGDAKFDSRPLNDGTRTHTYL